MQSFLKKTTIQVKADVVQKRQQNWLNLDIN